MHPLAFLGCVIAAVHAAAVIVMTIDRNYTEAAWHAGLFAVVIYLIGRVNKVQTPR
jgi:hypothetical protein